MVRNIFSIAICIAALGVAQAASAGTIIKLGLGGDIAPDIAFSGGVLSTVDDGDATTSGDQNTNIEFSDFLAGEADILNSTASFSLSGITSTGDVEMFAGVLVAQNFTGGTLSLYDASDTLLLSGDLGTSILAGSTGTSPTGSLLSVDLGTITGGTLAPQILPNTLSFSIALSDVNGGAGFSASGSVLNDFTADATLSIAADQIPEPASVMLMALATCFATLFLRRGRK